MPHTAQQGDTVKPRIVLTEAQRKSIRVVTSKENWFHSYTTDEFAVCSNTVEQKWKKVLKNGKVENMP